MSTEETTIKENGTTSWLYGMTASSIRETLEVNDDGSV